ncbi:EAL domain-containing protein [Pseudomonas matsuisoli]|uniref:Diguanylate phosphodiesterase n=1 Tax=Pseudomonas matsuisoli TaxID=1515666 RepID=A0A917UZB4_9PSED|nr:EAL domain-containing protein [Pseudomonas matsuisoli]GGK00167.1 diguanylate phosphodiesterase [Pseudomonas matsuisoli]
MNTPLHALPSCAHCRDGAPLDFAISMAFQPIIDIQSGSVFAHEALVRGTAGEGAGTVLARVDEANRYAFDQACRMTALTKASPLNLPGMLSINFMPNAVYKAETCIRATFETARKLNFPLDRVIFEVTEQEDILDLPHLVDILRAYRKMGFLTAIDDFGAGYAHLNLLADFQPNLIKLDMHLIRGIDADRVRQVIVESTLQACRRLNIRVIAEGVETADEYVTLREMGVRLFQGYLFAKPAFEALPAISWPNDLN